MVKNYFCYFKFRFSDEELKNSCHDQLRQGMSQTLIVAKNVEMVLCGVKEVSRHVLMTTSI